MVRATIAMRHGYPFCFPSRAKGSCTMYKRIGVCFKQRPLMPCTINETEYANSYVCSPYTGILYPQSEVDKIDSLSCLHCCAFWQSRCPCHCGWQNQSSDIAQQLASFHKLASFAQQRYNRSHCLAGADQFPTHAIAMRSLNDVTNGEMIRRLRAKNFLMRPVVRSTSLIGIE